MNVVHAVGKLEVLSELRCNIGGIVAFDWQATAHRRSVEAERREIAVPPTLSIRRKCRTYASRCSVAVRKWKTARSCQMSTGATFQSPVTSGSIQVTRVA